MISREAKNPSMEIAMGPEATTMADTAGAHRSSEMKRRTVLTFAALFACIGFFFAGLVYFATLQELEKQQAPAPGSPPSLPPPDSPPLLDDLPGPIQGKYSPTVAAIDRLLRENDCTELYIDMGTNIGVQPRKLYEPKCYPKSSSIHMFQKVFGKWAVQHRSVCTIGFEPNKRHASRLVKVERHLMGLGARVKMFTATGIGGHDGNATFFTDNNPEKGKASRGAPGKKAKKHRPQGAPRGKGNPVTVVSLHSILGAVQDYGRVKTLLIKLDIEGGEYEALGNAAANKVLCSAANKTFLTIEEHPKASPIVSGEAPPPFFVQSLLWMTSFTEGCNPSRMRNHDDAFLHDVTDKSNKACYLGAS
jgi:hypothetical protein